MAVIGGFPRDTKKARIEEHIRGILARNTELPKVKYFWAKWARGVTCNVCLKSTEDMREFITRFRDLNATYEEEGTSHSLWASVERSRDERLQ